MTKQQERIFVLPEPDEPLRVRNELRQIMPRIQETYRKNCLAMREALAIRDYKFVGKQAHRIKGSGGSCGFPGISEIGQDIERALSAGDDAGVARALDHLEASVDEILDLHGSGDPARI